MLGVIGRGSHCCLGRVENSHQLFQATRASLFFPLPACDNLMQGSIVDVWSVGGLCSSTWIGPRTGFLDYKRHRRARCILRRVESRSSFLRKTICLEGPSATMKPILFCVSLTILAWGFTALTAAQGPGKPAASSSSETPAKPVTPKTKPAPAESKPAAEVIVLPVSEAIVGERSAEDLAAIQGLVKSFVQSFNAHQPAAVAELFTLDAEIIDEAGRGLQGRPAIEKVFAGLFSRQPEARIHVKVDSLRFLGKVLATEEGLTTTVGDAKPGSPAEVSRYVVTYVKQGETWKMASARDIPDLPRTAAEHLRELEWLVGTWVDENGDSLVGTTFRWSDDKHFLLSDFTIQVGRNPAVKGTQRIGWDPRTNELRSWTFDSDGGFGEAVWTRDGNRWISKTTGVTHDGRVGSATNILTQVSKDLATFQSRDRISGGVAAPDIVEIPIVRQPPPPAAP